MTTELDRIKNALLRRIEDDAGRPPVPLSPVAGFFHFRYSYTEISAQGSNAYVKRRETRFENGRLVTEECEGAVDGQTYQRMVDETQRYFVEQMTQAMRLFLSPFSSREDGE